MKKIFTILGGVGILALSTISFVSAYTQEQIEAYKWAYQYKLTTQPTIEEAKINSPLTRQAFAKMVVNYLENVVGVDQSTSNSCYFPDEGKITSDLVHYTKRTCAYQIMGSNGKNFNPTQPIDRAQLGTVFSRILWGDKHDVTGKGYYIYHVNALKDAGIMNNISNVSGITAKRGDVLIMFKRMYEKYGSNIYLNGGNPTPTNAKNSNLDILKYNDSFVDIFDECDSAMEDFSVVFDDEDPSVDLISKSLQKAINSCKSAKDKANKLGDFEGDSALKDAIIMTLDANINYLKSFEATKPYWNEDNISENDENYQKIIDDLEKKSYMMDKSFEHLASIQEDFAQKHGLELDYEDESTDSYMNNTSFSYSNDVNVIGTTGIVVYTGKDGRVFYYDKNLLKTLRDTAEKKGESDLVKYLEVELKHYDSASDFEFDPDEFSEALGIDLNNVDAESLTKKQKEELVEKFGIWAKGIMKKVEELNNKYEEDLEDVTRNVRNDKFGLKEKYEKTKDYLEFGNTFLDKYCDTLTDLLKVALTAEDEDNAEEGIRTTISVLSLTLDLKSKTDEYDKFNAGWVKDTIDLLGGELIY